MKNRKKTKKVVIGGTFDVLHDGHKFLLRKAFSLGGVTIGLSSDILAQKIKQRKVADFSSRKRELEKFIQKSWPKGDFKIIKIKNKFGPTIKEDFDYIVVSPETYKTALLINKERQKKGRKNIKIVKIKFILAKDGQPISATRILKGVL